MVKLLVIGMGGFVGALLRYGISGWVYQHTRIHSDFPYGTLAVNLLGSFVLGLIVGYTEQHIVNPQARAFLTIGLLGALTTFSTFSFETIALMEAGSYMRAFGNIFFSVLLGLGAVMGGLALGRYL